VCLFGGEAQFAFSALFVLRMLVVPAKHHKTRSAAPLPELAIRRTNNL